MTKNRFLVTVIAASALYFFLYWVLNDLFLYAIGGALGIVVRLFSKQTNVPLLIFLWVVLLGVATMFYYKFKNKPVKYLFLFLVAVLLYVVDFILYEIMSFDTPDRTKILLNVAVMVLTKAIVLSLIIHFENKTKRVVNT
jgi:hypothetical protein